MSYEEKYLKYKNKYLSLKNSTFNQTGGSFFRMPSMFNKLIASPVVNQNTIQQEMINFKNLISRMKTINATIKDQQLAAKIQSYDDNWVQLMNNIVNQQKQKEEEQKKYNGLYADLQRRQQNVNEIKNRVDSYTSNLNKSLNDVKSFISTVANEAKNSEALMASYESRKLQNSAQREYNSLVHQRRASISEEHKTAKNERKSRSRSSSTSSLQSLGSTPSSPLPLPGSAGGAAPSSPLPPSGSAGGAASAGAV